MKILFVTTISPTIGFLIPHIKWLTEQGNQVDVAFNITREVDNELLVLGCKIYNIQFQRKPLKKQNYYAYKNIKKLIKEGNYDLVHTHTPVASSLTRLACRNVPGIKVLYTAHGFHFYKGAPVKNWMLYYTAEKWLSRYTDCIITMNEEDYEKVAKSFNCKCIKFVNGVGIDLNKFMPQSSERKHMLRKEYGYNENDFILISVGELNYNKHQDLLIDVIDLLKNKIPSIKLLIAGTGDILSQYQKRVNKLGIQKNVELLGFRNDIANLALLSDVAVSASRREGLPVNVMEAMATGLPLVVTDCRGNRDLVSDQENGYVVGIDDVKGFAEAIEILHNSAEIRENFGRRCLEIVNSYSLDKVMAEMKQIYLEYL